jgi:tetratricopeptide (TPR) repeat protein
MALLGALLMAALGYGATAFTQPPQTADPMAEVRRTLDAARKEIAAYTAAAGAPAAADHPAVKWDAELWAFRDRYPRSEASALASAEAVRLLNRAELWERAQSRIDSLGVDDPAWERLPAVIYEAGIARKELPATIDRLSRVVAATSSPRIKSSALIVVGRAHRRQGNVDAAVKSFEAAKAAAPRTPLAEEADGLVYEIRYLSAGLPAPKITGKSRSGRAVTLEGFRGKAVVLVFWGTT